MTRTSRDAFSLMEVLVCLLIFSMALPPIISMFTSSHRVSVSARHLLDATVHAQTLLEAAGSLTTAELPQIPVDTETVILPPTGAGAGRWTALVAFFQKPTSMPMDRRVVARRFPTGELQLRVDVEWLAVQHDPSSLRQLSLVSFSTPRAW